MNFFSRLKEGLSKTRTQIASLMGKEEQFTDTFFEHLEEALLAADIGVELTDSLIDRLRETIKTDSISTTAEAYQVLKSMIIKDLTINKEPDDFPPKPWVMLIVGVNGVGKTTTIGKLAHELHNKGKSVILGAADTFRAGAVEQLRIWADRTSSQFVAQQSGSDAASVAFDTMEAAKSRGVDVVILDTAGRLHTKVNLMSELEKILRVMKRNIPHAPNEILMVVDATSGQNALKQAQVFNETLGLTGLIITKLDGTAKGGIALSLTKSLNIPIRKIGVGEGIDDLQDFDPKQYVEAMFGDL